MSKFDDTPEQEIYSPQEVDLLIPALEKLVEHMTHCKSRAHALAADLHRGKGKLSLAEDQLLRSQVEFLMDAVQDAVDEIAELGGVVKDLDEGLVDFFGQINGQDAWLCWKKGETHVRFWHRLDAGFSTRKPIPRTDISTSIH